MIGISIFAFADTASAKELVDVVASAQTMFNRIGIAAISIGITLGGICFAIGLSQVGRFVLMSGLVGAAIILGAPSIVSLVGRFFGSVDVKVKTARLLNERSG